jgi:hypothetical protein
MPGMQEGGARVCIGNSKAILSRSQKICGHHLTRIGLGVSQIAMKTADVAGDVSHGCHTCWSFTSATSPTRLGRCRTTGLCRPDRRPERYPYLASRGPTYLENSHANRTWNPASHQTACEPRGRSSNAHYLKKLCRCRRSYVFPSAALAAASTFCFANGIS